MGVNKVFTSGLVLMALVTMSCSDEQTVETPAPEVTKVEAVEAPAAETSIVEEVVEESIEAPAGLTQDGYITNAQDCLAEGGTDFESFCFIPIRPDEYHGPEYDGAGLGVKQCLGEIADDPTYCRIKY